MRGINNSLYSVEVLISSLTGMETEEAKEAFKTNLYAIE